MTDVWRLYEKHAAAFDRDRSRYLMERGWLEALRAHLADGAHVLDLGCGMGEPIARWLMDQGLSVTGVDAAPAMIALCRERFPHSEWITADMRGLVLGRRFDAVIAWNSFFHLSAADQRPMFATFAEHLKPGDLLLFTAGPEAGERIGEFCSEPLFHASLAPAEYEDLLARSGFAVLRYRAEDPDCGLHTVWLAQKEA